MMWIIPSNHPLYSAFAPELVASKEDLNALSEKLMLPLFWKSKPLSVRTYLAAWNRVWWLQHLSGRILKHSHTNSFTEKYTESLADIRVSHFQLPENKKELKTQDTFFRIYSKLLSQFDLFGASLKTSQVTSAWDMTKFTEAYQIWATQLRQESLQRRKLAHHTEENGYLSLPSQTNWGSPSVMDIREDIRNQDSRSDKANQGGCSNLREQVQNWGTPNTMDSLPSRIYEAMKKQAQNGGRKNRMRPGNLREQIDPEMVQAYEDSRLEMNHSLINWSTPNLDDANNVTRDSGTFHSLTRDVMSWPTPTAKQKGETKIELKDGKFIRISDSTGTVFGANLQDAVRLFPTPSANDHKGPGTNETMRDRLDYITEKLNSHPDQTNHSTNGKNREQLNPAWVAQLMGTTLEKTFYVPLAMQLLSKPQN